MKKLPIIFINGNKIKHSEKGPGIIVGRQANEVYVQFPNNRALSRINLDHATVVYTKDQDSFPSIAFFDLETDRRGEKVFDYGAINQDGEELHTRKTAEMAQFLSRVDFLCGHNIIEHDYKYVEPLLNRPKILIDTLFLSPLLFPSKPYHHLVKDDKLQSSDFSNPLSDAIQAKKLFEEELAAWEKLDPNLQEIFYQLIKLTDGFRGFFLYLKKDVGHYAADVSIDIRRYFSGKICKNVDLTALVKTYPVELAYCLALINASNPTSLTPPWVIHKFPKVLFVMEMLRGTQCRDGCEYCNKTFNIKQRLTEFFGYEDFRKYENEPLQRNAVQAAVDKKSLIVIFPTGGGKSLTFQLPALIDYEATKGLTVVISPLQSLMVDQVMNLKEQGICGAVTINGQINPLERAKAVEEIENGDAKLLYISPEALRSDTIERLLRKRRISRFVIDEAHCFSAWGQDFRVDYMYIAEFIKKMQGPEGHIPVSCFTATAKQKVISDINTYFRLKLGLDLELFATKATRKNLNYYVYFVEDEKSKYSEIKRILSTKDCPTIIYASKTKTVEDIAGKLQRDGYAATYYHGQMEDITEKLDNQNKFMKGEANIMVATSAFGMGVDKDDVGLIIHYDISNSLENYVQEAGRAARDPSITGDCYVLFNSKDLDSHFSLLRRTQLSINEIQQVWTSIKKLCGTRNSCSKSAVEIARGAGWDTDIINNLETKVKAAVYALENAGYIKRENNMPKVFADGINAKDVETAVNKINSFSDAFDSEAQITNAKRVIHYLISRKSRSVAQTVEAESRIDVIAMHLGLSTEAVAKIVEILRMKKLLADSTDLVAYLKQETSREATRLINKYERAERFINACLHDPGKSVTSIKQINTLASESADAQFRTIGVKDYELVLHLWQQMKYVKLKKNSSKRFYITSVIEEEKAKTKIERRAGISKAIVDYLFSIKKNGEANFSLVELLEHLKAKDPGIGLRDVKEVLRYLTNIKAVDIDGSFLVMYQALHIKRLEESNLIRYKKDDYNNLSEHYSQKAQQIHIVGKYANIMAKSKSQAAKFIYDYFNMDYSLFLKRYFAGDTIDTAISAELHNKIFEGLTPAQRAVMNDTDSQYISVLAGPGSGKTRVLVHKLASLILIEHVKPEQLMMLTFSRTAAYEFKSRLIDLIGESAYGVEVKTFHSYAFDIMGREGSLTTSDSVIQQAVQAIESDNALDERISKLVLVLDEAQDIGYDALRLIRVLIEKNESMRVIAVGDPYQSIIVFKGANPNYMVRFANGIKKYSMMDNFRSDKNIVGLANVWRDTIEMPKVLEMPKIDPWSDQAGNVRIIKYKSLGEEAILEYLKNNSFAGSRAVLTRTNEEALLVANMLNSNGFRARVAQSYYEGTDQFNLNNLYELYWFKRCINKISVSDPISNDTWKEARERLKEKFALSDNLNQVLKMIDTFEKINPEKYRDDFIEFLSSNKFEDFYDSENDVIWVSTIHKAKGKEFDSVHLYLRGAGSPNNEFRKVLYVGKTRAKHDLVIHVDSDLYDNVGDEFKNVSVDNKVYMSENELAYCFAHRGVFLDYFIDKQERTAGLMAGMEIELDADYILSEAAKDTLRKYINQGYRIKSSVVRFQVVWKKPKDGKVYLILLPEVHLVKESR